MSTVLALHVRISVWEDFPRLQALWHRNVETGNIWKWANSFDTYIWRCFPKHI